MINGLRGPRLVLGAAWVMGRHQEETQAVVTRGKYHCHIADTDNIFRGGIKKYRLQEQFGQKPFLEFTYSLVH